MADATWQFGRTDTALPFWSMMLTHSKLIALAHPASFQVRLLHGAHSEIMMEACAQGSPPLQSQG